LKRIVTLLFTLALTLSVVSLASGAIHSNEGEFDSIDTWYSIDPKIPYWQARFHNASNDELSQLAAEIFINDQTFLTAGFERYTDTNTSYLQGGYLFDSNFFVGVEFDLTDDSHDNKYKISPGYRYDLLTNGYLAFSFDFESGDGDEDITGLETYFKYYTKNTKTVAQVYKERNDRIAFNGSFNFKADRNTVLGCNYRNNETEIGYNAGVTWSSKPFVLDLCLGEYGPKGTDKYGLFKTNFMYNYNKEIGLSVGYERDEQYSDPQFAFNIKYSTPGGKFKFSFSPQTEHRSNKFTLAYYSLL
jgi:hypothetical protein